MKPITLNIKSKVVKLFLGGYSYDEIAQQVGIAKGSVVNIIGEFREGNLPLPPGMGEYVDVLRQLAVDLKKHNTSIAQLKIYLKLHVKLQDMGVDSDEVEQWLDICGDIASPIASMPVYCATKAGIHMFSVSLRHQLKDTPVKVFEIVPPAVDTELGKGTTDGSEQEYRGILPSEVAAATLKALKNDEYEVVIGEAKGLVEGSRKDFEKAFQELNSW